jgi:hypothetical protein
MCCGLALWSLQFSYYQIINWTPTYFFKIKLPLFLIRHQVVKSYGWVDLHSEFSKSRTMSSIWVLRQPLPDISRSVRHSHRRKCIDVLGGPIERLELSSCRNLAACRDSSLARVLYFDTKLTGCSLWMTRTQSFYNFPFLTAISYWATAAKGRSVLPVVTDLRDML